MKKILFVIGTFLLLLACAKNKKGENDVSITVHSWNQEFDDRNGKDYVRLWINDTLLLSDTCHINIADCTLNDWYDMEMNMATIHKFNQDSIKIRAQLVSLDSILFGDKRAVDTTFYYKIDKISYMNINYYRELGYFRIFDPITTPQAFHTD